MVELAPHYKASWEDEITLMTQFTGEKAGIPKTLKGCKEWKKKLVLQYNLHKEFTAVDERLLNLLVSKCEGNILVCLEYFLNLITNGYVSMNSRNRVEIAESLE